MVYTQEGVIKDSRPWAKMFIAGATAIALAVGMFAQTFAASTVTVAPGSMQGWQDQSASGGSVSIANDAPAGYGTHSLELTTDNSNPARAVYYRDAGNVDLDTVTELAYFTKQVSASNAAGSASYFVGLDLDGDGDWDTNVIHEPYWQNGGVGDPAPVVNGVWQSWDVDSGLFWSSRNYDGPTLDLAAGAGGPPFYTLSQLKAGFPDAKVLSYGTNVGTYNPEYVVRVDAINFNGTTYDFELLAPDTSAPDVEITSPTAGIEEQGDVMLGATITDDQELLRYYYFVRNATTGQNVVGPTTVNTSESVVNFSRTVSTTGWADGEYIFQVEARDAATNKDAGSTDSVRFMVNNVVDTKDDCKNGGWMNFLTESKTKFKNQGQCVAYNVANDNASFKRDNQ